MGGTTLIFFMGFLFGGLTGMFISALLVVSADADRKDNHDF